MKLFLLFLLSLEFLTVPVRKVGEYDLVSLNSIRKSFGFPALKAGRKSGFVAYGHKVWIYPDDSTYRVDGTDFPTDEILFDSSGLYLSADVWADILSRVTPRTYYWDTEKKRFIVSRYPPSVKEARLDEKGDTVIFVLRFNGDLKPRLREKNGGLSISIKRGFYRGRWKFRDSRGLFEVVKVFHTLKGVTVDIRYAGEIRWWKESSPGLLKVYFVGEGGSNAAPLSGEKPVKGSGKKRKISLIVIDPGHGGKDPGAIGPRGTKEKNITLSIAKKLKRILEKKLGVRVLLTRDRDRFVPLLERAKIANRAGADLFISIHCNSGRNRKASGVETYFLSEARTEWERAVAAYENSAIKYEIKNMVDTTDILKYILMDMAQNEFLRESQDLAAYIEQSLAKTLKKPDRGVKQAGFYVLFGAYMPAVLVEVGFLSNRREEKLLASRKYQEKIAYGIYRGIKKFKEKYERGR